MPNVLLLGCHGDLVTGLRKDSRWQIAIGKHSSGVGDSTPSPLHWNLILDDCCNIDQNTRTAETVAEQHGIARYEINWRYLGEAERAHGISFRTIGDAPSRVPDETHCRLATHLGFQIAPPQGFRELAFDQAATSAEFLSDFVEQFRERFRPSRILQTGASVFQALFADAYGDAAAALLNLHGLEWLLLPNIPDKDARLEALIYLCYRTAPKLWPDVYSDSFQPRKVQALEKELSRMVAERRSQELALEGQIDSERRFYAPYVNLTVTGDDALKDLVGRVFEDVFGCSVKDLDHEIEEGERKTLDLRIESGDWSGMLEVRSSGNRNSQVRDVERLDENYELAAKRHGEAKSKILVFNGMYWRDADERRGYSTFGTDVVDEAKIRGIGLITTQQLLDAIEAYRNEEMTREQFIQALAQPGLFHEPWK
jgi:hypothetical protein